MIISCDLPGEADADCNGDQNGLAFIDDCGLCASGETGLVSNIDIDCCGDCFGTNIDCSIPCYECGNPDAINYNDCSFVIDECEDELDGCGVCDNDPSNDCDDGCENIFDHNEEMCIYDLCTDYLYSNDYDCNFFSEPPYNINETLGCESLETEFSLCYPEDCETTFKFSDFEDKIIWIIYEADW